MPNTRSVPFEIPRRAVPGYLRPALGDHYEPGSASRLAADLPAGHRFLLYFHSIADKGEEEWIPLESKKRIALEAVSLESKAARQILQELNQRQARLFPAEGWQRQAELTSPLLTGSGNPHPVENGFAFLSPYGVPYLAGSGIKGVMRRAAEEMALLCEDSAGWTLARVWALFGFDEKSAYFSQGNKSRSWQEAYDRWVSSVSAKDDPLLNALMQLWLDPNDHPSQEEFLCRLKENVQARRKIHYQGLLAFEDAFPDSKAKLGVDILNPHHRSYYQGDGPQTPHDADQPVPVFFLVIVPGAKFVLRARPLPGRRELWNLLGNWKELLDAAFEYASQWLGFGAKTSVGYGALEPDRKAEQETPRKEREEAERAARLKENKEEQKRAEAQRLEEEEAERKRREAEEAAFNALAKSEQIRIRVEEAVKGYLSLSEIQRKNGRADLNRVMNEAIEMAKQIENAEERVKAAAILEAAYEKVGWADPGSKKAQKNKQERNRREAVAAIRSGVEG